MNTNFKKFCLLLWNQSLKNTDTRSKIDIEFIKLLAKNALSLQDIQKQNNKIIMAFYMKKNRKLLEYNN